MFKKKQASASLLARILVKRTSHFDLYIFFCIRVKPIDTTNDERERDIERDREGEIQIHIFIKCIPCQTMFLTHFHLLHRSKYDLLDHLQLFYFFLPQNTAEYTAVKY